MVQAVVAHTDGLPRDDDKVQVDATLGGGAASALVAERDADVGACVRRHTSIGPCGADNGGAPSLP